MPDAPIARRATTIILLRTSGEPPSDTVSGFEVFMVRRHRRSGFLPNAWVFPGGRVDDADSRVHVGRVTGGEGLGRVLGIGDDEARAFAVAGVRETFEEAGIWLGSGGLPDAVRIPLSKGELDLGELLDTHDARIDLAQLHPWSWWVTPKAETRRYDTRFFVALADGHEGTHDDHETVDSRWVDPRQVLHGYRIDRFPLAPPTWWTLRELAHHDSAEAVVAASPWLAGVPIQPIIAFTTGSLELLLPGHPDHPDRAIDGLATHMGLHEGTWVVSTD